MRPRLRKVWDSLQSSYWFVPSLMMAMAIVLWFLTTSLDQRLSGSGKGYWGWLYFDDVDSTRTLLLTIVGTIIGIVGVVFSILMVPLTIAATQFGPRLLRTFLRDTGTHLTLGTFTATFVFCLLVLLQLHQDETMPLPQISVTAGLGLGLASFGMLIYFINHIATSIQASVVVAEVSDELHLAIDHELPKTPDAASANLPLDAINYLAIEEAGIQHPIKARKSGYVQTRDDDELLHLAQDYDLVMQLISKPGDFVVQDTPIAMVLQDAKISAEMEKAVNKAFILGPQRTLVQDITFGINELVEVAVRALSPAINDPFTAMTCLDWLGTALCRMCARTFPNQRKFDQNGNLRLLTNPITFTFVVDAAFNQIREYGRSSTAVTMRLLDTIAVVAKCAHTNEQRTALLRHVELVEQSCQVGLIEPANREAVTLCLQKVMQQLHQNKRVV
jgi:uncharacterized membrane protein